MSSSLHRKARLVAATSGSFGAARIKIFLVQVCNENITLRLAGTGKHWKS